VPKHYRLLQRHLTLFALAFIQPALVAAEYSVDSHIKYELFSQSHRADSLVRETAGASSTDQRVNMRINLSGQQQRWQWRADYQLVGLFGDSVGSGQQLAELTGGNNNTVSSDAGRLMDLTATGRSHDHSVVQHRLDRLFLAYTGDRAVVRLGRQAVSWGNGLFYNPMDVFNPFDPAAVDREYKSGDDMLYGQYLNDSGSDWQSVWVVRRDRTSGKRDTRRNSVALKYHGFIDQREFDIALARHYDENMLALGGASSIGGALWRSDITLSDTDEGVVTSLVSNLSYSWLWQQKNMSGSVEYYHNGFGQHRNRYSPRELLSNRALAQRLQRGELFTLGRNYLAAALTIEMTPLWQLTPQLFANLDDHSALLQLTSRHNLLQELQLFVAVNLPSGSGNTEFGGVDSGFYDGEVGLSTEPSRSVLLQLAWYF